MLKRLIRGMVLTEKFGVFVVRRLCVIMADFGPLLRKFGAKAGAHVTVLETAFEEFLLTGSQTSFTTFFRSYNRLSRLATGLEEAEKLKVGIELERRAQTLLAKQEEFGKLWASGIQEAASVGKKVAQKAASLSKEEAALNSLLRRARKTQATFYKLWNRFTQVVSPNSPFVQEALRIAAERAPKIK